MAKSKKSNEENMNVNHANFYATARLNLNNENMDKKEHNLGFNSTLPAETVCKFDFPLL